MGFVILIYLRNGLGNSTLDIAEFILNFTSDAKSFYFMQTVMCELQEHID